jgi:hypothetical protein
MRRLILGKGKFLDELNLMYEPLYRLIVLLKYHKFKTENLK